ncbi:MAG: phosphate acyltransferase PlsX [Verrucomicrobiae bacterium]|nr:phosphate acyltransferase PlsX [Verrucomicrobiae bacterium]
MRLAVDVMGGDHGAGVVVAGAVAALDPSPAPAPASSASASSASASPASIRELILVGNEAEIRRHPIAPEHLARVRILHASEVVTMDDGPRDVLRRKKDSSMVRAIELVSRGEADAVLSCGNTGCLLAASTIRLRRLPGIDRPGIATVIPTPENEFVLLDAGANVESKPIHLAHYAIMGSVYSSQVLGYKHPRVGLLCNGTEETKGNELTQDAYRLCRQLNLNFVGNVEGHDLFAGRVDVVICDGFVGNITLKTAESLAKGMFRLLKRELMASPWRRLGAWIARGAFRSIRNRMDPDMYGSAPLLGLNGVVFKAHASATERAVRNGIRLAAQAFQHHLNDRIAAGIADAARRLGADPLASAPSSAPE